MDAVRWLRNGLRGALNGGLNLPGVVGLRRKAWEAQFASGAPGGFLGVHDSFAQALASAPQTKSTGYDDPQSAAMYRERMDRIFPADYPVVFWLSRCLPGARRLVDFGGHVGIQHYSYQAYLDLPEQLEWVVCDVPAVCQAGERIARERKATRLRFTGSFSEIEGADVLLASGSLQYLEASHLPRELGKLHTRPRHLIVNKLPVHPTRQFVTVQDTGPAYHAYSVFRRDAFVAAIGALGYGPVDEWQNAELSCRVPFHPDCDVPAYSGFYFRQGG